MNRLLVFIELIQNGPLKKLIVVELIDAKGIGVAQPKQPKNVFFACF